MVGIIENLAILLGVLACFLIIRRVWAWVIRTYPASPVVRFISALINQILDQQPSVGSFILCMIWAYSGFPLSMPSLWLFFQVMDLLNTTTNVAETGKRGEEEEKREEDAEIEQEEEEGRDGIFQDARAT